MNIERAAGALRLILPLDFNLFFFLLARRFDQAAGLHPVDGHVVLLAGDGALSRLTEHSCRLFPRLATCSGVIGVNRRVWGRRNSSDAERRAGLSAALREELRAWWLESSHDRPDDYVLPSSTGRQANPSNLRRDVLRPSIEAANVELGKVGIALIGPVTFHSLRRTYASLRCACGDDVAYTSAQIGHTDPRFTLRVYTQATKRRERLSGPHLRAFDRAIEWARMGTNDERERGLATQEATESPA